MINVRRQYGREILSRSEGNEKEEFSFLDLVNNVDAFPEDYSNNKHFQNNVYQLQSHDQVAIGFMLKFVVQEMQKFGEPYFESLFSVYEDSRIIRFVPTDFQERNELLATLCLQLREKSSLTNLKGWRDESYAVYLNRKPYVLVERAAAGLLGVVTYGAHVNGYVKDPTTKDIKFWIPRRSWSKATWPGMLDNIIAGGLGYPYGIFETVLKESMEEANLSEQLVKKSIKSVGVVSYFCFQGLIDETEFESEASLITPEVEYLYDLELSPDVVPKPNDGEVESFQLLSLQETVTALRNGEFKPNCALITVDFLIRHGYITPENEPNYLEIVTKMHRPLPFPTLN